MLFNTFGTEKPVQLMLNPTLWLDAYSKWKYYLLPPSFILVLRTSRPTALGKKYVVKESFGINCE